MRKRYLLFFFPILLLSCIRVNTSNLSSLTAEQLANVEIADHNQAETLNFLVLGDMGTGGANQQAVADAMVAYCDSPSTSCDFITALGDNIYIDGVSSPKDTKLYTKFELPYTDLGRIDIWLTPGNHDWLRASSVQSQIDYTQKSDRWRMPHNHYAVPNLPPWLHIYTVDTTILRQQWQQRQQRQQVWQTENTVLKKSVDEMLSAARAELCGQPGWRILFGHHPIYSSGKHGVSENPAGVITSIQQQLDGLIADCDVQVYMAGHDHHQELIQADGLTQIIQGAGGRYLRTLPDMGELVGQRWAVERFGFAAVSASADQLTISYFEVDSYGGGWEELCSWTLSADGELKSKTVACDLR
ncbi:MAG: tartrate-resistant acid phosphatase type 5 [Candidatus Promineifilaceae bacterium]|jgi:tartrate-resistant acid phosphatase type 5